MALQIADRVWDITNTSGTGTITLANTPPNAYQAFSAVCSTGDTIYYALAGQTVNVWEVGLGTFNSSGPTLARTSVLASSVGGGLAPLSGPTDVLGVWPAAKFSTTADIEFIMDGGGGALTTGVKGYLKIDFACTITEVTLLADQSGSITVDIWKCSYANFDAGSTHPVAADSITASDVPAIAASTKFDDTVLTGWTKTINAGDVLAFDVKVAATNITRVTVVLNVARAL